MPTKAKAKKKKTSAKATAKKADIDAGWAKAVLGQ